jgi:hypothetical protein
MVIWIVFSSPTGASDSLIASEYKVLGGQIVTVELA